MWSGLVLVAGAAGLAVGSVCASTSRNETRQFPAPYVAPRPSLNVPSPGQVDERRGYVRRACPETAADQGTTAFDVRGRDIAGTPGAGGLTRSRVVGAGTLDVRDGRLLLTGGENLPYPHRRDDLLDVPRGDLPVTLLEVAADPVTSGSWTAQAVAVHLRPETPARWVVQRHGPGSDGATLAVAGDAAAARLASVRTPDAAMAEIDEAFWHTPCETFSARRGTTGPAR